GRHRHPRDAARPSQPHRPSPSGARAAPAAEEMQPTVFTFDTTHHALWAEEIARAADLPHEVVPAPPEANARCNIALATLPEMADLLSALLRSEAVPFRVHRPPGRPGA